MRDYKPESVVNIVAVLKIAMDVTKPVELSTYEGVLDNSFKMFLDVLSSKSSSGNVCMSPFGVSSVANTILYRDHLQWTGGADLEAHQWRGGPLKIRGLSNDLTKSASVQTSNIFWAYNKAILPEFMWNLMYKEGIQTIVGSTNDRERIRQLVGHFNAQVCDDTGGRISAVFTADTWPCAAYAVIVNAVYFKGVWKTRFNPRDTEPRDFYVSRNKLIQVPTMVCDDDPGLLISEGLRHFRIMHIPFQDDDGAYMHVIIPHALDERDVQDVLQSGCVTDADWWSYIDLKHSIKAGSYTVQLPKWKTKSEICLDKTMDRLGVKLGVDNTTNQFCAVEVDEAGCIAMAITMSAGLFGFHRRSEFYVNKPFIWIITRVNPNGGGRTVLFQGLIIDPSVV